MKRKLSFTKMQGIGNDFVIIDARLGAVSGQPVSHCTTELARKLCDRRFGIGADQVLWVSDASSYGASTAEPRADFKMEIFNPDGSMAEMCGNGIRAVALYVKCRESTTKEQNTVNYHIETMAGIKDVNVDVGGLEARVRVNMGVPVTAKESEKLPIIIGDEPIQFFEVNMGNPHAVCFTQEVSAFPVEKVGPKIENHPRFPARTNVEFVEIISSHILKARVWERGAGITLACGTGACAAAVAGIVSGRAVSPVEVCLPGGKLLIHWGGPGTEVFMEGPAEEVFQGEMDISS